MIGGSGTILLYNTILNIFDMVNNRRRPSNNNNNNNNNNKFLNFLVYSNITSNKNNVHCSRSLRHVSTDFYGHHQIGEHFT